MNCGIADPGVPDKNGWLPGCVRLDSPNFDARPDAMLPTLLILHAISLPPGRFGGGSILDLFTNRLDPVADPYFSQIATLRVSSHFLIRRDGVIVQLVSCRDRAWHAGISQWRARPRCNDYSLGIELEGSDDVPFSEAQYLALDSLAARLSMAYPLCDVAGHSDVAPGRKTDPGPCFDWRRLRFAYPA